MGDGPTSSSSENQYRRIDDMPWPGQETVPRRYGVNGEPNNPLDARHEITYPDSPPRSSINGSDGGFLTVPNVEYKGRSLQLLESEKFTPPAPIVYPEERVPTPDTLRGHFPTATEVHAASGRFVNTNLNMAQLAWHGYCLRPQAPWPSLPHIFPIVKDFSPTMQGLKMAGGNFYANLQNLTAKKYMTPWAQKIGPIGIAGGAFAAEFAIDAVTGLDKSEYQIGRFIADACGPSIVFSKNAMFGRAWQKYLGLVLTHLVGRLADKFTEEPMKKWMRTSDQ